MLIKVPAPESAKQSHNRGTMSVASVDMPAVQVVIPVFSGTAETIACVNSVLEAVPLNRTRIGITVVYDAGPDAALFHALNNLASTGQIILLVNEHNRGFVHSVNRGIQYAGDNDVILLNSDTRVHGDWVDRLVTHATTDDHVGTVTPFSNNAEICSWPRLCQDNNSVADIATPDVDRAFAALGTHHLEIPTAVGFCMYIRRHCITAVGLLDEATFGHGYGEENDFCMRAARSGFRHLLACNVYVFHQGGVSFGADKLKRVEHAIATVQRLYPEYGALVARHIHNDPARQWRFAAELSLPLQQGLPLILHISHGIGGGTDRHVVELAHHTANQALHAMAVPQSDCLRLVFPTVTNGGLFQIPWRDIDHLVSLLQKLQLTSVHLHHIKGWEQRIHDLLKALDRPVDVTLHDYYFLHINPALTDRDDYFCSDPRLRDEQCSLPAPFPVNMTAAAWRDHWAPILRSARRVFIPSNAAAAIYQEYFPWLSPCITFHPDHERSTPYPDVTLPSQSPEQDMHVVVLGALSRIKGADMLERTALLAEKKGLPIRFTLIGYAYRRLAAAVNVTGSYRDQDLAALLQREQPHLVWFPCLWPETYSYTLSRAMKDGLPVMYPDLGAFPERLQGRPGSWSIDWRASPQQCLDTLMRIRTSLQDQASLEAWSDQPNSSFDYHSDYFVDAASPDECRPDSDPAHLYQAITQPLQLLLAYWLPEIPAMQPSRRKIFRLLLWLHSHRFIGMIANLLPLSLRRNVKRWFTQRPLHDHAD